MEDQIKTVAREALDRDKVSGYICVDQQGLCLAKEGVASENHAALIASISQLAAKLEPGSKSPVIQIGSDKWNIVVQTKEAYTTALFKAN